MNTYRYTFAATCPSDGEQIIYSLSVWSKERIMVERIKKVCAEWPTGFHEDIADDLHKQLGAVQTLRATHQGVEISTMRDAVVPFKDDLDLVFTRNGKPLTDQHRGAMEFLDKATP